MAIASQDEISAQAILAIVPQQYPFRFLDRIVELDAQHIIGEYTFDPSLPFYQGVDHDRTPETILIETMAQSAIVGLGLYLIELDRLQDPAQDATKFVTLFTEAKVEFFLEVPPGETVRVHAVKEMWRRRKIRSNAQLFLADGRLAAQGIMSGMGVSKSK